MLKAIINRWKEARADVLGREIKDILDRYPKYGWYERYELLSAFISIREDLEEEHGAIPEWPHEIKIPVAKQLLQVAKIGFRSSAPHGAIGAGLLSLYIEVQTVPGEKAIMLKNEVDEWYQVVVQTDLKAP